MTEDPAIRMEDFDLTGLLNSISPERRVEIDELAYGIGVEEIDLSDPAAWEALARLFFDRGVRALNQEGIEAWSEKGFVIILLAASRCDWLSAGRRIRRSRA